MTGGTLALGCAWTALCILLGVMICWPVASWHALKRAAEDAEDARDALVIASWKGLADADPDPAPLPVQPAGRAGPGKHRHPAGPRHAALPAAGRLPAEPRRWAGTITVPAPAQSPPWDQPPEPQTEVLEPTAVLPGMPETDTAWTRRNCEELQAYIDGLIAQSEPALKEITSGRHAGGAR